jgi:hypothetical protein
MNQQFNVDQVAFAQESIQTTINTRGAAATPRRPSSAVAHSFAPSAAWPRSAHESFARGMELVV